MRIPSYRDHNDIRDNQALTPLIDCVFQLLIFFLCASVGRYREDVLASELTAGTVSSENAKEQEMPLGEVWLRLRRDNSGATYFEINDGRYDDRDQVKSILMELAAAAPEIPVILDIAADVPAGDMVAAYDVCRAAGFRSIKFAASDPRKAKPPEQPPNQSNETAIQ